ncbi:TetR/AcrR family transcriptional regulator [Planococcus salinarum]|uniref:TetR/AcrR family transcriptional regulator n=1 Tax=Planococcus salinarum TaxID=622695 RepID=UPI000E3E6B3C|nr:TetR/AcrR family transcriptional regulator [Planococcus salinarum]TAA72724.1 TetR/AcrR family transcriptional regulator [Planococcus salinarum]
MPKLIDHETKKLDIAHAAWRIILKEGVAAASVRNIAKEAGITLGALRYYFASQEELLAFTEDLIHAILAERTSELFMVDLQPQQKILQLLNGLLPGADRGEAAAEARLIFKLQSKYTGKSYDAGRDSIYQAVKSILSNLVMLNLLKKDTDLGLETDRLYALMDGLAMDAMLRGTENRAEKTKNILSAHINSICKEPNGNQL